MVVEGTYKTCEPKASCRRNMLCTSRVQQHSNDMLPAVHGGPVWSCY